MMQTDIQDVTIAQRKEWVDKCNLNVVRLLHKLVKQMGRGK